VRHSQSLLFGEYFYECMLPVFVIVVVVLVMMMMMMKLFRDVYDFYVNNYGFY
jgi:hypothetical protein